MKEYGSITGTFMSREIPLQEPTGSGPNTWIWDREGGQDKLLDVLLDIVSELHLDRRSMGFVGMKDLRAVKGQWICVSKYRTRRCKEDRDRIRNEVHQVTRNEKKLRMGRTGSDNGWRTETDDSL